MMVFYRRLEKVVMELKTERKTTNESHAKIMAELNKANVALKNNNEILQSKVDQLEARVTELMAEGDWTSETILGFSNVDFKAILGVEKEQWSAYLDHLELQARCQCFMETYQR